MFLDFLPQGIHRLPYKASLPYYRPYPGRPTMHFNSRWPPLNYYENNTIFLHFICVRVAHVPNIYRLICICELTILEYFQSKNRHFSSVATKLRICLRRDAYLYS